MSSKGKAKGATSGEMASFPKLRFPEFQKAEGWNYKRLGPFLRESTGRAPSTTTLQIFSSTREGLKRQDAYFDGRILDNNNDYGVVPPGCFVYRHMSDDGSFKFNINNTGEKIAVSKEYPVFEVTGLNSNFLLNFLNESAEFKRFAFSQKAGGTRTRLYFRNLCEWRTSLPQIDEQQKIADCLDSVDALIAAQGRKVEALKAHKKGLMQQLFPQEGKTQPRRRFPRVLRGTGEWSSDSLGNLFDITSGGTPERTKEEYWDGGIPWITTSLVNFNIITEAAEYITNSGLRNSSAKIFPETTILLAMYGQGKTRGQVAMLGVKAATNQACAAILPRKGINPNFVFLSLVSRYDELRGLSNSGGQENLSQGLIKALLFSFPSDTAEQQRIADCLTSLDDLITAETRKLDMLKAHKKGLMQQLFPSVGGDDA